MTRSEALSLLGAGGPLTLMSTRCQHRAPPDACELRRSGAAGVPDGFRARSMAVRREECAALLADFTTPGPAPPIDPRGLRRAGLSLPHGPERWGGTERGGRSVHGRTGEAEVAGLGPDLFGPRRGRSSGPEARWCVRAATAAAGEVSAELVVRARPSGAVSCGNRNVTGCLKGHERHLPCPSAHL